ncbi:hypothetical protein HK413_04490 [Mucilaginibacter sp. S1162]|uniref:Uncharacterized protein n=1 Tax=Mucilaginibacter humi TaxID=2732510 RepID=A0ABX1W050_9SPHI|nr:hypothetical protein [Mucilaginibacter humi]NNU33587.1 hypothetical protein [Mucilaginibacter humi]
MKRYKWNITRRSVNLKKELEQYKWKVDRAGKPLNKPVDTRNHLIDPLRYVALNKLREQTLTKPRSRMPHKYITTQNNLTDFII